MKTKVFVCDACTGGVPCILIINYIGDSPEPDDCPCGTEQNNWHEMSSPTPDKEEPRNG
jgi:hypothetical protein